MVGIVVTALTEIDLVEPEALVTSAGRPSVDARFADIFEAAPYAMLLIDRRGRIEMVNAQAARMFGYARDDLLGRPVDVLLPQRYRSLRRRRAHRAAPAPRPLGTGRRLRAMRKDGSRFPVEIGLSPIPAPDGPRLLAAVVALGERRSAERALRDREARLRSILATAPDPIIVVDDRGIVESFSPAAERLFGRTAAEILGHSVKCLMPPPYCDYGDAVFARYLARGRAFTGRPAAARRKDGAVFPIELSLGESRLGGRRFFTGFVRDLSERRQAEARLAQERAAFEHKLLQAQKLEAIGQLTGGLAHDFNNLLGIIMGCLDLLQPQVAASRDALELVDSALDAARRGADLTRRLLIFARQQPLQAEYIHLPDVVFGIVKLLDRAIGEDVEIALELDPQTWPVIADSVQLQTSLANLATNARDAMPKGGRLTIATGNCRLGSDYAAQHPEVTPGDYALIEVGDTGTGMPPDVLRHAFEPFYTTKERGRGTGLGLSMVFGFVKQSGGHVSVYSEVGRGTVFRLYLPRAGSPEQRPAASEPAVAEAPGGVTVLVVEDDRVLRRVAVRQLRDLGYAVIEADGALAALALLETQRPDLLFSDIVMPGGIDGFELAREAIRRRPGIKVVLTSGFTGPKLAENLATLGQPARLLGKPYQRSDLAAALREALGR